VISERTPSNADVHGVLWLDAPLVVIVASLLAFGLAMMYSASHQIMGTAYLTRQTQWIAVGTVAALAMAQIPYHFWRKLAVPILLLALAGLVAVLVYGEFSLGAKRTFMGSIQPSEFAKLSVIVYISAWVVSKGKKLSQVEEGLIPFIIIMSIIAGLLVLEPSFSVAIIILVIGVTIFFVGGGSVGQMLALGVMGLPIIAALIWRSEHGRKRIIQWLAGLRNPLDLPPDVIGVWLKVTFSRPVPDRLAEPSPVPLGWSDYLYAYMADRLGFVAALLIVVLFAALAYRCLAIALNAPDQFGLLMGVGITAWVITQATIHMGASMALLPSTGQPLPFMSYGGSAMLACMLAMGMMMSISRASPAKKGLYESFASGWRNRRARLPDPGSGGRPKTPPQRGRSRPGDTAPRRSGQRARSFGGTAPRVRLDADGDDGPRDWRQTAGRVREPRRRARRPRSEGRDSPGSGR